MKHFFIILSCMVLAAHAVTYVPSAQRLRRDVSELLPEPLGEYLPPHNQDLSAELISDEPIQTIAADEEEPNNEELPKELNEPEVQGTAVLGENGYEYRAVQTDVSRTRRDVSHLKLNYLPPFESHQPSNEYLPPASNKLNEESPVSSEYLPPVSNNLNEDSPISSEYLPPVITKETEEEIVTAAPQPSNEYLPPAKVKEIEEIEEISTEVPEPSKGYLPPAKLEEPSEPSIKTTEDLKKESENETSEETTIAPQEEETTAEVVEAATEPIQEDTAIFAEDGYHYKKPSEVPLNLFDIEEPVSTLDAVSGEYLLPLEKDISEAEGPSDGESAVLAEDGYHYRVIKRRY